MIEEQGLIADAQHGDVSAYEQLVQQYEQIAFRVAYLITHEEHDAADAAQDAFLRAFKSFDGFRGGNARAWLLTIVRNAWHSRRKRDRMNAQTDASLRFLPSDGGSSL